MNLEQEEKYLKEILDELDNRIEPLKDLVQNLTGFELNYSLDSIKYLELILSKIKSAKNDKELQKDAALYIGETFKKSLNGNWGVFNQRNNPLDRQPYVAFPNNEKKFFPFNEIHSFFKNPTIGYFMDKIGVSP